MKISSLFKKRTSLLLLCSLGLGISINAQKKKPVIKTKVYTGAEHQIKKGGSTFELFQATKKSGTSMTVIYEEINKKVKGKNTKVAKSGTGKLKGKWKNVDNTLIRESKRPSNTTTNMSYNLNIKKMKGNAYYGGYGWWSTKKNDKNTNIVEFYVTDGYTSRDNPTFDMKKADLQYKVDGGTYDVFYSEKRGLGSVFSPSTNFLQIKAVRTSGTKLGTGKIKGNITWKTHFDKWRAHARVKRTVPKNLKGKAKTDRENKYNTLKKFAPRSIFEISWLMEGFGSTSEVDFDANATFKAASKKTFLEGPAVETVMYPNPTSGEFAVSTDSNSETTIAVFDLNGKLVSETTTTDASETLLNSDNSLTSGLYIVKITNAEGTSTQKLVVN